MTDNELAREIRDGNQLAFTMAYDKYQRQLYAFACRYTRNGTLAEDIVALVLLGFVFYCATAKKKVKQ